MKEDLFLSVKFAIVCLFGVLLSVINDIDLWLGIVLKAVSIISFLLLCIIHWKTLKEKFKIHGKDNR